MSISMAGTMAIACCIKKIKYVLDTAYIILNHTETKGETPVCKDIHFDITNVPSYISGFIPDEID